MTAANSSSHNTAGGHPNDQHLEEWIAEIGEARLVEMFEETERGVVAGTIPTFSDMELLLEHVNATIAARRPA
ncbi:MAG: hypothetical protein M3Y91_09655 [Actinomycetota bacterium]|nr:hypothetical protein [Actinomycetota bacterium]